jgi:hypothetical protein
MINLTEEAYRGQKMMELFGLAIFYFFIDIYERVGMV